MSKKILIVEDEKYLREMYKMKFEQCGYEVKTAGNGKEGLEKVRVYMPDLILLDLVMPLMNGYEFLSVLRKDKKLKDITVYIWSNLGQASEIKKGIKGGADGYLIKTNLTPGQLVNKVKKIFDKKNKDEKANNIKK